MQCFHKTVAMYLMHELPGFAYVVHKDDVVGHLPQRMCSYPAF